MDDVTFRGYILFFFLLVLEQGGGSGFFGCLSSRGRWSEGFVEVEKALEIHVCHMYYIAYIFEADSCLFAITLTDGRWKPLPFFFSFQIC